jgi:hypothetical protein
MPIDSQLREAITFHHTPTEQYTLVHEYPQL